MLTREVPKIITHNSFLCVSGCLTCPPCSGFAKNDALCSLAHLAAVAQKKGACYVGEKPLTCLSALDSGEAVAVESRDLESSATSDGQATSARAVAVDNQKGFSSAACGAPSDTLAQLQQQLRNGTLILPDGELLLCRGFIEQPVPDVPVAYVNNELSKLSSQGPSSEALMRVKAQASRMRGISLEASCWLAKSSPVLSEAASPVLRKPLQRRRTPQPTRPSAPNAPLQCTDTACGTRIRRFGEFSKCASSSGGHLPPEVQSFPCWRGCAVCLLQVVRRA